MKHRSCIAAVTMSLLTGAALHAQGVVTAGLVKPFKADVTLAENLVVAESGTGFNDGKLTLVTSYGAKRPLLSGLPSGINAEGAPLGPTGVSVAVSTVYVLIGEGDSQGEGAAPVQVCNPNGLSSPIFSSLLSATFSPGPEAIGEGFALTVENIQALADGHTILLENSLAQQARIHIVTDFRNFIPDPVHVLRQANPFAVAITGFLTEEDASEFGFPGAPLADVEFLAQFDPESALGQRYREHTTAYVVDSGMNTLTAVNAATGRSEVLARFAPTPNPLFPSLGGPFLEAVPTGVRVDGDRLIVTLLAGFPFPPGSSRVVSVDRETGATDELVGGLSMSTDAVFAEGALYILNLSTDFLSGAPGRIVRFDLTSGQSTTFVGGLIGASGIALRAEARELIVTENFTGLMKRFPLP